MNRAIPKEKRQPIQRMAPHHGRNFDTCGQQKCAYAMCECQVSYLETYCFDYCSDADYEQEAEIQCDCSHSPCALVVGAARRPPMPETKPLSLRVFHS